MDDWPGWVASRPSALAIRPLAASPGPLAARLAGLVRTGSRSETAGLYAAGLTDGLPVTPPTPERVEEFLRLAPDPAVAVGPVLLAGSPPTRWDLAANCVLAGCEPEWFPVVLAALEAVTVPAFNLLGIQTTTSGVAPMLVVSGPVTERLGIGGATNAMGGAWRANQAIGRSVRLCLQNLGNVLPGVPNPSTIGLPGKTAWCLAEAGPACPWAPLHRVVLPADRDGVTVIAGVGSVEVILGNATIDDDFGVLGRACAFVQHAGLASRHGGRRVVATIVPPEAAQRWAAAGLDRAAVRAALYERAVLPAGALPPMARAAESDGSDGADGFDGAHESNGAARSGGGARSAESDGAARSDGAGVRAAAGPDDILVVVSGGIGIKGAVVPTWGASAAVSAPVAAGRAAV